MTFLTGESDLEESESLPKFDKDGLRLSNCTGAPSICRPESGTGKLFGEDVAGIMPKVGSNCSKPGPDLVELAPES